MGRCERNYVARSFQHLHSWLSKRIGRTFPQSYPLFGYNFVETLPIMLRRIVCVLLFFLLSSPVNAAIRVRDDLGREIAMPRAAGRIVSLYAGHTENLIAIGAGKALVAATVTDDPRFVADLPRLSLKPGLEQILALKPDLVLMRPMQATSQASLVSRLESLGTPVLAISPPTWESFGSYLQTLGRVVGREEEARKAVGSAEKLMRFEARDEFVGVFLVVQGRQMTTCARGSWADRLIELSGGRNVALDAKAASPGGVIAPYGSERLLAASEGIDAVILQQGAMNVTTARDFLRDPRFSAMRAVRTGAVYDIDEADISRPSLLRLERSLKLLRKMLGTLDVEKR